MKTTIRETSQRSLFADLFLSTWHWAIAIHAKHLFACQTSEVIFYGIWCSYHLSWGTAIQGFWSIGQ